LESQETIEILEWAALLSILVLAKARVKRLYPLRYCPSEQRGPAPKATQPGGRERFGLSGYVGRSSFRHRGTDMLVALALPSSSRAAGPGILTGSLSLGLAASLCNLG